MAQREEYVRAFNRMKDELNGYKMNNKGKDGEVSGLQSDLISKSNSARQVIRIIHCNTQVEQLRGTLRTLEGALASLSSSLGAHRRLRPSGSSRRSASSTAPASPNHMP